MLLIMKNVAFENTFRLGVKGKRSSIPSGLVVSTWLGTLHIDRNFSVFNFKLDNNPRENDLSVLFQHSCFRWESV